MEFDTARVLRGALAGGAAALVWAAQQPLDKRVFESDFDDVELLGKLVTRGPGWPLAGLALHATNGAIFGAVFATAVERAPGVDSRALAVTAALVEHVSLWPTVALVDRLHPARGELPVLSGNRRAWWQAGWRHLLFGLVLGELERRLNGPPDADADGEIEVTIVVSSNGSGKLEHVVGA